MRRKIYELRFRLLVSLSVISMKIDDRLEELRAEREADKENRRKEKPADEQ